MKTRFGMWLTVVGALLCFSIAPIKANAQTTGSLVGTVTDPSGAVVPGVNVTLRSVATGEQRKTVTNAQGDYTFNLLPPQTYEMSVDKAGFATVAVSNLVVNVDTTLRHDVALQLQKTVQHVTVSANPATVETESPALGTVIGSHQIVNLPLNGRDFFQLATLTAGAYPPAPSSQTQALAGGRTRALTVSVSGSRESSAEFLFDGIPAKHEYYGGAGFLPPPDSIAEFKIEQGYFSPQFGLPAVVNVVTKSGSNDFHGVLYEFLRNDVLDAKNFFDTTKPPFRQNQFGGSLGGPVLKNKLFFFGGYDGFRVRRSSTSILHVPSIAEVNGDFSADETPIIDPETGLQFPGNQIPSSRFVPFAQKFNQYMPKPNHAPDESLGGANLIGTNSFILNDDQYNFKINYVASSKDSFFGRFTYLDSAQKNTSLIPGNANINPLNTRSLALNWTHIFSPHTLNSLRAGLDRVFLDTGSAANAGGQDWPTYFGFQNLNKVPVCNGFPQVALGGYDTVGFAFGNCTVTGNTNFDYIDNFSMTRGRHDITLGGEAIRRRMHVVAAYGATGNFNFTGQYTGNSVADYLLGQPQSASGAQPIGPGRLRDWTFDMYINDNMRVTPKLTANFGLRWQYAQPFYETQNHSGYFDLKTGKIIYAGVDGARRSPLTSHWADFAPRVGFAYALSKDSVIRASYGIFYDRTNGNQLAWCCFMPLYQPASSVSGGETVSGIDMSTLFPAAHNDPQGGPGSGLATIFDRPTASVQQWTLSFQHTFAGNLFAQLAYVGSRGEHLSTRSDINQLATPPPAGTTNIQPLRPYPHFGYIIADRGIGDSYYDGLQATLRKYLSHGMTLLSAYTYASSIQTVGNWGEFSYQWTHLDRGPGRDDPRQRWVTSAVYALPFGQEAKGFTRQVIGGWTANGIFTLQSGYPFSVGTTIDTSNTGMIFPQKHPDRVCNGNLSGGQRNREHWFDTSCFVLPAQGSFGNAGILYLRTPGTTNLDFALLKTFHITENKQLEFRSEFFNSLNNVNFGQPGSTLGRSNFGVITSAGSAREIQFALKFTM